MACPLHSSAISDVKVKDLPCGGLQDGLLAMVGVPPSAVRNVLMHKDLVPRAFACDYRLVADLLRRVNESFREHACPWLCY